VRIAAVPEAVRSRPAATRASRAHEKIHIDAIVIGVEGGVHQPDKLNGGL
jgi:hypothetical protein